MESKLFCFIIFWLLILCPLKASAPPGAVPDSIPEVKEKIHLLFAGDIMGHGPQIKSAELWKNKVYDYDPCFKYVKPIIQKADLAIANLEVTLPGKEPYQGYPRFRSPDDLALALRTAGFDLLVTANNHSNDAGKSGVINTINTLQNMGFYQTGTFKNQSDRDIFYPLLVYKNGYKLAFLNYTYDTNQIKTVPPTVVNEIDEELIEADLSEARQMNPDIIIVMMHWGDEYQMKESKQQQQLADKIFGWGADLIVGAHPHVVQPIKKPASASGPAERYVAYSLGNFISNQQQPNTDGGLMLEIELSPNDATGKLEPAGLQYIPVWRYIQKEKSGKSTFYSLPASAFEEQPDSVLQMKQRDLQAMKKSLKTLRNHLNPSGIKERKITLEELGISSGFR